MSFDLGDPVDLPFPTVNSAGTAVNLTTVTLTVTKPDGATDTPSVANPPATTGQYTVRYTPTVAGPYRVRWVGTDATNPQSYTDAFDVRDSGPPLLFSLADAKSILNVSATANDAKLRSLIESATAAVEFLVGSVVRRSVSERYETYGADTIVLRSAPVISVSSITRIYIGGPTYTVSDLDVDTDTGIIQNVNGRGFYGPLRLAYVAGRTTLPAAIRDGARLILKHLWDVQNGLTGLPRLSEMTDRGTTVIPGLGYDLPNRAVELLHPYTRSGHFA